MGSYSPDMLQDLLPQYYKRLFPYSQYARWLQYGKVDKNYMAFREFSFTLENDVYLRYQCFASQEELETEMIKRCPHKIDIGAVYNARPTEHKKLNNFTPQEKELVFDIDLTDYDDVRTCCSGANICPKCWRYMSVAVSILDTALREDFGYKNLLWVYSGRRGVHCWVCDPEARKLNVQARAAVAEYLQIVSGGEHRTKKVVLKGDQVHPSVERAVNIIKKNFQKLCLEDQDILGDKKSWDKVLALISDDDLRQEIEAKFPGCKNGVERWNVLRTKCLDYAKTNWKNKRTEKHLLMEIILQFAYPRLDIAVSKGLNHLLKAPFCIHPKTGRVCVPFRAVAADKFNPSTVPTVLQLMEEIDTFSKDANEDMKRVKDYKKTSLKEAVTIFEEFLSNLAETWKGELMKASDASLKF